MTLLYCNFWLNWFNMMFAIMFKDISIFLSFSCVGQKIAPSATITSDLGCEASTFGQMNPASFSRISSSTMTSDEGSAFATNLSMPVATFTRKGSGFGSTITRLPSSTIVREPGVQVASKTGVLFGLFVFNCVFDRSMNVKFEETVISGENL
jgi:hypothetical protein